MYPRNNSDSALRLPEVFKLMCDRILNILIQRFLLSLFKRPINKIWLVLSIHSHMNIWINQSLNIHSRKDNAHICQKVGVKWISQSLAYLKLESVKSSMFKVCVVKVTSTHVWWCLNSSGALLFDFNLKYYSFAEHKDQQRLSIYLLYG